MVPKPVSWFMAFLLLSQTATWILFLLAISAKQTNEPFFVYALFFVDIAAAIYMFMKLVQYDAPLWILMAGLALTASFLIQTFANIYWHIGTTANFSMKLTPVDATYFSVGTLSGGTGDISATSELSRSLQTVQTFFDLAFTLLAVGLLVARMSDVISFAAKRGNEMVVAERPEADGLVGMADGDAD